MSEKKTVRRSVAIAFGIICIVLASGLVGALAYYVSLVNDKDNAISMLNSQISQLTLNITNLQNQVNSILNGSTPFLDIITSDPSAWLNRRVVVEGNLSGPYDVFIPEANIPPYNYVLNTPSGSIGVLWNSSAATSVNSMKVTVYGVVRMGKVQTMLFEFPSGQRIYPTVYYIEAETVEFII